MIPFSNYCIILVSHLPVKMLCVIFPCKPELNEVNKVATTSFYLFHICGYASARFHPTIFFTSLSLGGVGVGGGVSVKNRSDAWVSAQSVWSRFFPAGTTALSDADIWMLPPINPYVWSHFPSSVQVTFALVTKWPTFKTKVRMSVLLTGQKKWMQWRNVSSRMADKTTCSLYYRNVFICISKNLESTKIWKWLNNYL